MAHRNDPPGREPLRRRPSSPSPERSLTHRISSLSDFGDIDANPYDPDYRPDLRGRESLVSLDSQTSRRDLAQAPAGDEGGHIYAPSPVSSWKGSFPYTGAAGVGRGGGYSPVADAGPPPSRKLSRSSRKASLASSLRGQVPESIQEEGGEEFGMSLLRSAAPMGGVHRHETIAEAEPGRMSMDVTSISDPLPYDAVETGRKPYDESRRISVSAGAIGQGFRPDHRVTDSELLLSPVSPRRNLSRTFTRRRSTKPLGRAETIRHKGQDEANRRDQVIEVILEEQQPAGADLSSMEGGPRAIAADESRTNLAKEMRTQTFYPQPNWKPLSMQWPYLTMLVVLSVLLAGLQEILYRKYEKTPLVRFQSPNDVSPGMYFAVKFVPTVAAVVYGVLWQFVDFEVRRLEAYYQLSKEGGALAAESINVDYVTSFNFWRPFRAVRRGHYAVALSSVATTFAVSLVPTFAAAAIILEPSRHERRLDPDAFKSLHFASTWSRLLTTTLAVCAACGCGLVYMLQTRRTGLLSDVRGIAGLASMAVVSHILMDFKDVDTASHREIHHRLKQHRYMLRNSSLAPDDENPVSTQDQTRHGDFGGAAENPHPLMLRARGFVPFLVGLSAYMVFIPAFLFTRAEVVTATVPWLVTALAVCLKLAWNAMETAVRMMEPYYILSRRHAPSKTLALDYTALPFGYMPLRALFNGHLLVFLVGFGTVMAEFLTILVTSLSSVDGREFLDEYGAEDELINAGQETVMSFYVSFGLAMFILLYMSAVACLVFLRRRHPFLPRQPTTIASILAFIHQSRMLYDFVGTEKLGNEDMVQRLEQHGRRTYGLGWFEGRDEQAHCGVDQEELLGSYAHGVTFLSGNRPWNQPWDVL